MLLSVNMLSLFPSLPKSKAPQGQSLGLSYLGASSNRCSSRHRASKVLFVEMLSHIARFCVLWSLSHPLPVPETLIMLYLWGLVRNMCNMPAPAALSQLPRWGSLSAGSQLLPLWRAQEKRAECHLSIRSIAGKEVANSLYTTFQNGRALTPSQPSV